MYKVVLLGLLLLGAKVYADALSALDSFLQKSSIVADFTQTVYGSKKDRISQGKMQIERPNKFRWEYAPDEQLIISDGKMVYIYDKPLQQVSEKQLNTTLSRSPALLLAGGNNVKKDYIITVSKSSSNLDWIDLKPKNINDNNGFQLVTIGFTKDTQLLSQMKFIDSFGNKSSISFSNVKVGVKIPDNTFKFIPPSGVDVIKAD